MNIVKILGLSLIIFGTTISKAQEMDQAQKAIDAEQFEKAKSILKKALIANPDNGKISFLIGNLYLRQSIQDSAKYFFDKGLAAKENTEFNYIGLGHIALNNNKEMDAISKFTIAEKEKKKKEVEHFVYIGKAYTYSDNPNYKKAIEYLLKGKAIKPNDSQLLLALGDAYDLDKNQNDAYQSYSNAFDADPTLIRAKLQLGVLLKQANAFEEAKKAFDGIVATSPNFGPVYRELAETYFKWGTTEKGKYQEYTSKSLGYYEKYMSLTDYSLASRFRHAEFLIVAKDYVALEKEALEMKKLDNVNPRIARYLGYASYENGKPDSTIKVLTEFISNPSNKIIGRDYLYLGLAQLKQAVPETATVEDQSTIHVELFNTAVANLQKAVDLDKPMANELNDYGKKLFEKKLYKYAAAIYEVAISNPKSKNYLYDNFYLGYAIYFDNSKKEEGKPVNVLALKKADLAFENVIKASPTTQDAYIYRARLNKLFENDPIANQQNAKCYEDYIKVVTEKGESELSKSSTKSKLIEAYQSLTVFYKEDKVKAKEYLNKALIIEPENQDLLNLQSALK